MQKTSSAMQKTLVLSLSRQDPLKKGVANHSTILAWRIPWREEPGGLQSMRSQFPIPDLYGGGEVTQDTLQNTWHVNLNVHQNHLKHLLRYRYLDFTPEFLIQEIWGGTLEFASLTICQELPMLFVHQRRHFESHWWGKYSSYCGGGGKYSGAMGLTLTRSYSQCTKKKKKKVFVQYLNRNFNFEIFQQTISLIPEPWDQAFTITGQWGTLVKQVASTPFLNR